MAASSATWATAHGDILPRNLRLTDYLFLLGAFANLGLALYAHDTYPEHAVVRHLSLLLLVPGFLLTLAGSRLFVRAADPGVPGVLGTVWPLLALAAAIVSGSLWARLGIGEENTFLTVGLYMFMVPIASTFLLRSRRPEALLAAYFRVIGVAIALAAVCWVADLRFMADRYHELEFLVIPPAVWFVMGASGPRLRWMGFLACLATAAFIQKNTAYLAAVLTLLYLLLFWGLPALRRRSWLEAGVWLYAGFIACMVGGALIAYVLLHRDQYLPSGNPNFRMHTYAAAWSKFVASPIWGNGYTGPATTKFTLFEVAEATDLLPTHSDTLDILANGGVLGLALFVGGLVRIFARSYRELLAPGYGAGAATLAYGHALACMSLVAIVTCSFNPVLLQVPKAFFIWTNLGLLVGLALLARREREQRRSGSQADAAV